MVAATEYLLMGRILEFVFYPVYNRVHLDGLEEFALLLHNVHKYLLCFREFVTTINI